MESALENYFYRQVMLFNKDLSLLNRCHFVTFFASY